MKKLTFSLFSLLICLFLITGCAKEHESGKQDAISFSEGQYYAAAHLGYQHIENLDAYAERYLDSDRLPVHHISDGDYYLVIPRYPGTELRLYRNDLESSQPALIYEDPNCRPFILQCNVSDIFPDATIQLTCQGQTVEFSPFISLKDGSVDVGEYGLELTLDASEQ